MSCHANRLNIALSLAIALTYALLARPAQAAESPGAGSASEPRRYSLEVKPLPLALSLREGSFGLGGEFEVKMIDTLAMFADLHHLHVKSTDEEVEAHQSGDPSHLRALALDNRLTAIAAGLRFYGSAQPDSWYVGGKLGGATQHVRWGFGDERFEDDRFAWRSQGEAGYRWTTTTGWQLRLAVGLLAVTTPRSEVSTLQADGTVPEVRRQDIEEQSPTRGTRLSTVFDLGVGLAF